MHNLSSLQKIQSFVKGGNEFSPSNISGLRLWLDAGSGAYTNEGTTLAKNGQTVQQWNDKSGLGFNATQAAAGDRPTFLATGGPNSKPAVQFVAATGDHFDFGDVMASASAGEVFVVIKKDSADAAGESGLWNFGSNAAGAHYPFSDNDIYEEFGSTSRHFLNFVSDPLSWPPLTDWRLYNAASASSDYKIRMDGTQIFTTGTNTVGWDTAPELGINDTGQFLGGSIAEIIIYNKVLSTSERGNIHTYFRNKYALTIA